MAKTTKNKGANAWLPSDLPDLRKAKLIAVDTETHDPNIQLGPGGVRGDGKILGISIATDYGWSGYIPVAHPNSPENFQVSAVKRWFNDQMRTSVPKIGANILYDLEWLMCSGYKIDGPFFDVQFAEPLLDEHKRKYNLASLSEKYLSEDERKATTTMEETAREYLGKFKGDVRKYLWQLPAVAVGPYAHRDATATLQVFQKQKVLLEKESLWELFRLECRLIPLLIRMRLRGVRVDIPRTEQTLADMEKESKKLHCRLKRIAGQEVAIWTNKSIASAFDKAGLKYPKTAIGTPSFEAVFLREHEHPLAKALLKTRQLSVAMNNFLKGMILQHQHKGRLYTQFHPLRTDDKGTVSGRFSSANPNLQQVPGREDTSVELVRNLFIPDEGEEWWKSDYSQIEYRLMVHYAFVTGVEKAEYARDLYRRDPNTDFHQMVADLIQRPRKQAKNINFGLAYGMGKDKLAKSLGLSRAEAEEVLRTYHREAPFLKVLSQKVSLKADSRGFIRTILQRKRRFPLWEPRGNYGDEREAPLPHEEAIEKWGGGIQRAYTYRALNALIQGSAADLMKKAMVDMHESGVFDVLGIPALTVHDELDGSKPKGKKADAALREAMHIMTSAIPLEVPVMVDCSTGANWFDNKEFKL